MSEDRWSALVEQSLAQGLTVRCTATGLSMEPAIGDGETIVVAPVEPGALVPGMVVLTRAGGRALVHRVIAVDRDAAGGVLAVRTRGDALVGDDPPVPPEAVRGRVLAVVRGGIDEPVSLVPRSRHRLMGPMVMVVLLGLLAMILMIKIAWRF